MKWFIISLLLILATGCSYNIIPMPFPCYMWDEPDQQYTIYEDVYDMTPGKIKPDGNGGYIIYEDVYDMTPSRIIPSDHPWPSYYPNR